MERYEAKKAYYQNESVASSYDAIRFSSPSNQRRNRRKIAAIQRALISAGKNGGEIKNALDIPCGTGRLFPLFNHNKIMFVGADISEEMIRVAITKSPENNLLKGIVRCNAEHLPFKDNSFDTVVSIRFMFHIPDSPRLKILQEMCRVTKKWVIIDYRHRYTFKYWCKKLLSFLRTRGLHHYRFSLKDLKREFNSAGADVVNIFPTIYLFSDKWVVLGKKKLILPAQRESMPDSGL